MVFQSLPVYVDPPGWNQQEICPPPAAEPPAEASVRVGSMTDRARQAKIPLPEAGLKCPRCESTNTKFCYFNNYSFSQPRHFCKTCRRYWTRGGALRNVPVGGGCRRNKRSKTGAGSSKSLASSADRHSSCSNSAISSNIPPNETLPFFPSLHSIPAYSGVNSAAILDQWRIQQVHQFPLMEGLEAPPLPLSVGLFPFDGPGFYAGQTPEAEVPIKVDDEDRELAQRKYSLGIPKNEHFWGDGGAAGGSGGVWADISGFGTASAGDTL